MSVKEKSVYVIGVRQFKGKKEANKQYFVIDYVIDEQWVPKTDFISPVEFETMKKKLDNQHLVEAIGKFEVNDFDKIYLSDIEL